MVSWLEPSTLRVIVACQIRERPSGEVVVEVLRLVVVHGVDVEEVP